MDGGALTDLALALALGVALAAAAGMRVFVPLLLASVAAHTGHFDPSPGFAWLASWPALVTFAVAAVVEIAAYYLPGLDHALDLVMTPLALAAGVLLVVAPLGEISPLLRWSVAVVAGAGAAGITQAATALLRVKSTATTGGLGNPLVATTELGGSLLLSLLALLLPVLAVALLAVLIWGCFAVRRKLRRREAG
ncbi:MAG TPA: DUF4126 domain-containing protein [Steroidobacteraceae bacterium]|nr:DUF4126 domain-containing protein [Steroidobacteraceae bacterium]